MELRPGWYVVAEESELAPRKPNALRRYGIDWVLWRNSEGQWVLQEDRCPHRSARLSLGKIVDDSVACPFHGFQFDSEGRCKYAPEIRRDAPGLKVRTFRLRAFQGVLWVNWDIPAETPLPWFPELPGTCTGTEDRVDWPQHYTRCIENQLDHAHLPFVHATSIGRGQAPDRKAHLAADAQGLHITFQDGPEPKTGFSLLFPGSWRLRINDKMMPFIAFVPVDETNTRIYLRTYQAHVTVPGLSWVAGKIMAFFNRIVLNQDRRVVLDQRPMNVLQANEERLFPSDEAIRAYRKWLRNEKQSAAI